MVNQMISSLCWSMIQMVTIPQLVDVIRYLYGPLPFWLCNINLFLKSVVLMQMLLFCDAAMVIKYVSIFWLKNPAGFQDAYWSRFLNTWILVGSFIMQLSLELLPGTF